MATTYLVGTGEAQTTIAEVNALTPVSGDTVSFNKSEIFNDAQLNCISGVTYNSYGIGAKPLFNRSDSSQNIYINKNTGVSIDGLQFDNGKAGGQLIYIYDGSNIEITNCDFTSAIPNYAIYGYFDGTQGVNHSGIDINNCTFSGVGQTATIRTYQNTGDLGLSNIDITDNTFTNCPDDAIYIFTVQAVTDSDDSYRPNDINISRNIINTCAEYGIHLSTGKNVTVSDNTLTDIGGAVTCNAIQLNHITTGTISGNSVTTVTSNNSGDGCGIILDFGYADDNYLSSGIICKNNYVNGVSQFALLGTYTSSGINIYKSINSFIYNNVVINSDIGISLMNDESTGNVIYNNTIYNSSDKALSIKLNAPVSIVKNNIFHTADYGIRVEGGSTNPTEDYNSFYNITNNFWQNSPAGAVTIGSHSITSDPLLTSDYRLQAGSPCIDAGTELTEVTDDYEGNPRPIGGAWDIGAYEFWATRIRNATIRNATIR